MDLENGKNKEYKNLVGMRFGRLVVKSEYSNGRRNVCECICDCGNLKTVRKDHLTRGETLSCGCYQKEATSKASKKHGMKNTRIYRIWRGMHSRCENERFTGYELWGGRGIKVCEEWRCFKPFYEWAMSNGYREDLTIDRIDNNGNYCPENCRWATRKEQARNRRTNVLITLNGETKHISDWDENIGARKSGRVKARLNAGWGVEKAITQQVMRGRKRY